MRFGSTGLRFFRPPCVQVKTDSDPAWKRSERRGKGPNFSGSAPNLRGRNVIGVDRPSIFSAALRSNETETRSGSAGL